MYVGTGGWSKLKCGFVCAVCDGVQICMRAHVFVIDCVSAFASVSVCICFVKQPLVLALDSKVNKIAVESVKVASVK